MEILIPLLGGCFCLSLFVLAPMVGLMKVFSKAGQPGMMAFVPIYNGWLLVTEVCKMEPMMFILSLIPGANIYAGWMVSQQLAKKFGKSEGFGMGLFFLAPVFILMLGFSNAQYQGVNSLDDDEEEEEERPRKKRRVEEDDE